MFKEARSISPRSSGVSSTSAAPRFSSRRCKLGCAWDRNNPRLLGNQPGERYLSGCRLLLFRKSSDRSTSVWFAFRFSGVKRGTMLRKSLVSNFVIFVDLAGQKTLTKWAERNESDSEFFQRRQHRLFRFASTKASIRFEVQSPAEPHVHGGWSALLLQKARSA